MYHIDPLANATISGALTTGQAMFVSTTSKILVVLTIAVVVLSMIYVYGAMRKAMSLRK